MGDYHFFSPRPYRTGFCVVCGDNCPSSTTNDLETDTVSICLDCYTRVDLDDFFIGDKYKKWKETIRAKFGGVPVETSKDKR